MSSVVIAQLRIGPRRLAVTRIGRFNLARRERHRLTILCTLSGQPAPQSVKCQLQRNFRTHPVTPTRDRRIVFICDEIIVHPTVCAMLLLRGCAITSLPTKEKSREQSLFVTGIRLRKFNHVAGLLLNRSEPLNATQGATSSILPGQPIQAWVSAASDHSRARHSAILIQGQG